MNAPLAFVNSSVTQHAVRFTMCSGKGEGDLALVTVQSERTASGTDGGEHRAQGATAAADVFGKRQHCGMRARLLEYRVLTERCGESKVKAGVRTRGACDPSKGSGADPVGQLPDPPQ